MNLLNKLTEWLGVTTPIRPELQQMRAALEEGRRAKFDEDYERAMQRFDDALRHADALRDTAVAAVVGLHRCDVLMRQGRLEEAEQTLLTMLQQARETNQHARTAYILCSLGELAQMCERWADARSRYEEALNIARSARSIGAEGRALGHLADTYLHDGNASYAEHLLSSAMPKLSLSEDLEMNSYFAGLRGQAMLRSGQVAEGYQWLKRALQLATHMSYRFYQRHWSLVLGDLALEEGRFDDAQMYLQRALELFPTASNSPEYVRALCSMSDACLSLRDYEAALIHARRAVEMSATMEPSLVAFANGALGSALRQSNKAAESVPYLQAAVAFYEQIDRVDRTGRQVETLRNLAAALAEVDTHAALDTYQRAVEWATDTGDPLQLAQARRDLGLYYFKQRQYQPAIHEWLSVMPVYEERRRHAQIARLYTDIAGARKQVGQHPRAMKDYEQALMALNYVDETDYETRGVVLSNAATAYAEQGDVESADAFFNEAIGFAEKVGDQTAESVRRGNYGWFLLMVGRPRRAIAMLEQALELSRQHHLTLQQAIQTDNLGLAYDSLGDYQLAQRYHREALALLDSTDEPHWWAVFNTNLAATLLSLGLLDEAEACLDAVAALRSREDAPPNLQAQLLRARLHLLRGRPADADDLLVETMTLARRGEQKRLLAEALSLRSEQQALLQQVEAARAAWTEAQRLYGILRMPQAKHQPVWLHDDHPQES